MNWEKTVSGFNQSPNRVAKPPEWIPNYLKVSSISRGKAPAFADMEYNVLYYPTKPNFPAVEFFYKCKDSSGDRLIAFQVTLQDKNAKEIKESALQKFLDYVQLRNISQLTIYLVTRPDLADSSFIDIVKDENNNKNLAMPELFVSKVPFNYSTSQK